MTPEKLKEIERKINELPREPGFGKTTLEFKDGKIIMHCGINLWEFAKQKNNDPD